MSIVLNWNRCQDTLTCVASLRAQSYGNLSILVVDNGSSDECIESVERLFPGVHTLRLDQNRGYTGGNNAGIEHALTRGVDFVFLVNNDVELDPDAVAALVSAAQGHPGAAALGPTIFELERPREVQSAGGSFNSWTGRSSFLTDSTEGSPREVQWVSGSAIMVRTEVLRRVGPLDDRYFAYCEELDWCLRAQEAGYHVLHVPAAKIWHRRGATAPSALEQFLFSRNDLWLARRHCRGLHWIIALAYRLMFSLPSRAIKALLAGDRASAWAAVQGILWHLGLFAERNPLDLVRVRH